MNSDSGEMNKEKGFGINPKPFVLNAAYYVKLKVLIKRYSSTKFTKFHAASQSAKIAAPC